VITCSRCGKENQDLYKFCLGCGAKLQAAAAPAPKPVVSLPESFPPTPPPEPQSQPGVAKTAIPPEPGIFGVMGPTMMPTSAPAGMPAAAEVAPLPAPVDVPMTPAPIVAPSAGPRFASTSVPATAPSVQIGLGSVPMQVPTRPASLGVTPAAISNPAIGSRPIITAIPPAAVPATTAPHASPFSPPPADMVTCPSCGKQVAAAFAFCGGCGHRMKAAPGAVAEAAVQRADAVAPMPAAKAGPRGHITLIRPDGTEGGVFPLQEGENPIGRGQGALFDADPYLSPRHATFVLGASGLEVRDQRSLNGIFVRITDEEVLESGDSFRIGQELLRFDAISPPTPLEDGTEIIGTPNPGYWGRLSVVVGRDLDGPAFPLFEETVRLGRERGDILFPEDGYVSGGHCQLSTRDGRAYLKDLGSSNGSFLRVRESRTVPSGSLMLMGQQLFRVAYK
jgi:pSer/pThr/pTyr-binding forkhead associated (FHA) protein